MPTKVVFNQVVAAIISEHLIAVCFYKQCLIHATYVVIKVD